MVSLFFYGILIGIIVGIPVGAVGALTVQRTAGNGMISGLLTGLGSSVADIFYASVGVFGLTLILNFLLKYQTLINVFGSALIITMGIRLILKSAETIRQDSSALNGIKMFLSSFSVGITNPVAIIAFLFAFSYFDISGHEGTLNKVLLVLGVFIGTYIWWIILALTTYLLKKRVKAYRTEVMNKIFGTIIIIFGIIVAVNIFL